jgi:uncharacterized membrane protein
LHSRTLERPSSQLESLIVRTEFCHTRINRWLFGVIISARLGGEMFVSEWRRSRRNVLALPTIFDAPPSGVDWRGEEIALSCKFRGSRKAVRSATDSIPVLPEGWAGLYARLCMAITSLSVGFKRVVEG